MNKKFVFSFLSLFVVAIVLSACGTNTANNNNESSEIGFDELNGQIEILENETPVDEETLPAPNYTLDEVSQHGTREDCWLAINGKVYDATIFIASGQHSPAILEGCGQDATELFTTRPMGPKTNHPASAYLRLETLYIGELN